MARIHLDVADLPLRLTLKTMLEAERHTVDGTGAEVTISDTIGGAIAGSLDRPSLMLTTVNRIDEALSAMRQGVFGYILVPLQPGEAGLMVQRALQSPHQRREVKVYQPAQLAEVEARHIQETLRFCKGNQAKAARILGIGRNTLWRKLKQYKLEE